MYEKILEIIEFVETVNGDVIDDEVIPGIDLKEWDFIKRYVKQRIGDDNVKNSTDNV